MNAKILRLHTPRRKREMSTPAAVREILAALAKLDRRITRLEKTVHAPGVVGGRRYQ